MHHSARLVLIVLPVLLAGTACSGNVGTSASQECRETLRLAEKEMDVAKANGFSGHINMMKAANLMTQAGVQQQFEKYLGCIDKAQRARVYIQEAQK